MDWYFTEDGDIKVDTGDIAMTPSAWRDDAQQAYIRIMTEPGDYLLYRQLGAEMSQLYGMPQSQETGNYGKVLIKEALDREGRFSAATIDIGAIPTGPQTIRFDIYIRSGSRSSLLLSIEQDLGVT